jgi:hypothetical protein
VVVPIHDEGREGHSVSLLYSDEPWSEGVAGDFPALGGGLIGLTWIG